MLLNKIKFNLNQKFPHLKKLLKLHWNDGYIHEEITSKDRIFGFYGSQKTILKPDSNWTDVAYIEEEQRKKFESMACVSFSLLRTLRMIAKQKFGLDWNKSDRYTAKASGTTERGNTMTNVYQSVRKTHGVIDEIDYPFTNEMTRDEYFKALTQDLINKGQSWLKDFEVSVEFLDSQNQNIQKEALKYSPLWVSGYAWYMQNGLYRSYGDANHCFVVSEIDIDRSKTALDTYSPFVKKLAPDFLFGATAIVLLEKRPTSIEQELKKLLDRGLKYVMRTQGKGEIYEIEPTRLRYIDIHEWNNINVKMTADQKKLVGISEELFQKLS
jgi:hypothetical protein